MPQQASRIGPYPGKPLKTTFPFLHRLAAASLLCIALNACSSPACKEIEVGKAEAGLRIAVGEGERKRIGGEFFGFNLESVEFQLSLWDPQARGVRPEVMEVLSSFEGAVYRFPGGTTANYYRWAAGTGEPRDRKSVRIVEWTELPRLEFGLDEYLSFVERAGGRAWYVLNLQGGWDEPFAVERLAREANELAATVRKRGVEMLRWELGNELDRGTDMWPSAKYLAHARAVLAAVRAGDPGARFVGMMADYDAQKSRGITASEYNRAVAQGLKDLGVVEFEQHLYYDGPPDGPPLPNRLRHLCRSMEDARQAGIDSKRLAFWVTEHARWPQANPGEAWKLSWKKTADLGAAIGMADFLIALAELPGVSGSDLHALHGTNGPWPLFHRPQGSPKAPLAPSVTMHAYRMLNEAMLPVVLPSKSSSGSRSGYEGGYDARGAVFTTPDRKSYSVWAVNRDDAEAVVTLEMPALAGRKAEAQLRYLTAPATTANNYERADTVLPRSAQRSLAFDADGRATFTVPARSVTTLAFRPGG
jgi:hypothetical protein